LGYGRSCSIAARRATLGASFGYHKTNITVLLGARLMGYVSTRITDLWRAVVDESNGVVP